MADKKSGPREYRVNKITGSVLIRPRVYKGKYEGELFEPVDFTEAGFYLGYRFDPRSMYSITAPKGIIRGGHLESRSKLVTILSGTVLYALIDMRPGQDQGKTETFFLGDDEKSWGRSVLVPEGVIDCYAVLSDQVVYVSVGDQPYNAFDSLRTLDLLDPELGIDWPTEGVRATYDDSHRENQKVLSKREFIESLK